MRCAGTARLQHLPGAHRYKLLNLAGFTYLHGAQIPMPALQLVEAQLDECLLRFLGRSFQSPGLRFSTARGARQVELAQDLP